jgi:hypothetical protein
MASKKYDKDLTNTLISKVDTSIPRTLRGEDFKYLTDEQLDNFIKSLTEEEYNKVSEILKNRKLVISKGKRNRESTGKKTRRKKTRRKNKKGKKTRRRRR